MRFEWYLFFRELITWVSRSLVAEGSQQIGKQWKPASFLGVCDSLLSGQAGFRSSWLPILLGNCACTLDKVSQVIYSPALLSSLPPCGVSLLIRWASLQFGSLTVPHGCRVHANEGAAFWQSLNGMKEDRLRSGRVNSLSLSYKNTLCWNDSVVTMGNSWPCSNLHIAFFFFFFLVNLFINYCLYFYPWLSFHSTLPSFPKRT